MSKMPESKMQPGTPGGHTATSSVVPNPKPSTYAPSSVPGVSFDGSHTGSMLALPPVFGCAPPSVPASRSVVNKMHSWAPWVRRVCACMHVLPRALHCAQPETSCHGASVPTMALVEIRTISVIAICFVRGGLLLLQWWLVPVGCYAHCHRHLKQLMTR